MDRYSLATATDLTALAAEVAQRLRAGQVGILPTETVYGLMCRMDHGGARERLYACKGRDRQKPLQVLLAAAATSADWDLADVAPSAAAQRLATAFWPGPLTLVVPDRRGHEVGLRVPDHLFVRAVIRELGLPLHATSANLAGRPPAVSLAAEFADLAEPPDFAVMEDGGKGAPSTVVRLAGTQCECLREGALRFAVITEVVEGAPGPASA